MQRLRSCEKPIARTGEVVEDDAACRSDPPVSGSAPFAPSPVRCAMPVWCRSVTALLALLALQADRLFGAVAPPAVPPKSRTDRWGDPLPAGALARLGTVRLRHGGRVNAVVFSRDSMGV